VLLHQKTRNIAIAVYVKAPFLSDTVGYQPHTGISAAKP